MDLRSLTTRLHIHLISEWEFSVIRNGQYLAEGTSMPLKIGGYQASACVRCTILFATAYPPIEYQCSPTLIVPPCCLACSDSVLAQNCLSRPCRNTCLMYRAGRSFICNSQVNDSGRILQLRDRRIDCTRPHHTSPFKSGPSLDNSQMVLGTPELPVSLPLCWLSYRNMRLGPLVHHSKITVP